ncbi:MAG: HEPN domain-containing protein [Elusimicrobiota bacterium]
MNELINIVKNWIKKAGNDLMNAEIVIQAENPPTDTICFHCQQAAEKYIKAYLIRKGKKFKRVHDLVYLLELCLQIDSSFNEIEKEIGELTEYSVEARYPNDIYAEYDIEEAKEAIDKAKRVKDFILKKLENKNGI